MKSKFNLIEQPHITEKVLFLKEENNQVVFQIRPDTNKVELKNAIESIFGVTVLGVRTMNVIGKKRRQGLSEGKRADWKKAVVTLKEGDTIEYFEGA